MNISSIVPGFTAVVTAQTAKPDVDGASFREIADALQDRAAPSDAPGKSSQVEHAGKLTHHTGRIRTPSAASESDVSQAASEAAPVSVRSGTPVLASLAELELDKATADAPSPKAKQTDPVVEDRQALAAAAAAAAATPAEAVSPAAAAAVTAAAAPALAATPEQGAATTEARVDTGLVPSGILPGQQQSEAKASNRSQSPLPSEPLLQSPPALPSHASRIADAPLRAGDLQKPASARNDAPAQNVIPASANLQFVAVETHIAAATAATRSVTPAVASRLATLLPIRQAAGKANVDFARADSRAVDRPLGLPGVAAPAQDPAEVSAEQAQIVKSDIVAPVDGSDKGTQHASSKIEVSPAHVEIAKIDGVAVDSPPTSGVVAQVASAIAGAVGSTGGSQGSQATTTLRGAAGQVEPGAETSTSAEVAKSLRVLLHPEELGPVAVRISVRGETLRVHLRFDSADAANAVTADRNELSNVLAGSGLRLDHLAIDAGPGIVTHAGSPRADGPFGDTGSAGGDTRGTAGGETGGRRRGEAQGDTRREWDNAQAATGRQAIQQTENKDGSVYV